MLDEAVQTLPGMFRRDGKREQYGGRIATRWERDLGTFTRP